MSTALERERLKIAISELTKVKAIIEPVAMHDRICWPNRPDHLGRAMQLIDEAIEACRQIQPAKSRAA